MSSQSSAQSTNKSTTQLTGYPSIDKPWLKYYEEGLINFHNLPECSLFEYLYENNKSNPDVYALNFYGKKMTYGMLFEEIDSVSKAFIAIGVKPGDVVAVVSVSCVQAVLCFYALNKIVAVSNFLGVLASEEELRKYFVEGNTKHVVSLDLFTSKVIKAISGTAVEKVISFSMATYMPAATKFFYRLKTRKLDYSFLNSPTCIEWNDFVKAGNGLIIDDVSRENEICFLGHTGGTTGIPKSVILTNKSFNSIAWHFINTPTYKKGEVFLSLMPIFITYGAVVNMHIPLCLGMEMVLIPKFERDQWPSYFKKYRPAHIAAAPVFITPLIEHEKMKKQELSFVRTMAIGGEGTNVSLEERANAFLSEHGSTIRVTKGYGMTEVCAAAAMERQGIEKLGSVGIPFVKNNFMVYDNENQRELPYYTSGEICMQCVSVMVGYKDNQKETELLIKTHKDGSKWVHTGDIGHIDEDGFIFIEGRMNRMIEMVRNGVEYKVIPEEVERVISKNRHVKECCVLGCRIEKDLELKAYVAILDDISPKKLEIELRQLCEQILNVHQRPGVYEFLADIPRTAAKKVDYRKLEEASCLEGIRRIAAG